jgi:hypothetical protein
MVFCHVHIESSGPWNLLHRTLRTWSTAEILQSSDNLKHSGQCDAARIFSKTTVRPNSVVDVCLQWPVNLDLVGGWEDCWITICTDLVNISMRTRIYDHASTHKATEDLVTGLHRYWLAAIINGSCDC